jgi:hypothetical protein
MKKITIKNLIEFRGKTDKSKITYANNLKKEKVKAEDGSGGDYWISCLSAIRKSFKTTDVNLLDLKVDDLLVKISASTVKITKDRFQRNIDILHRFKEFEMDSLRPSVDINFLRQSTANYVFDLKGVPVEAKPCCIFSFSENGSEEIGGVWFVAKLRGFTEAELAMFADMLYRYLQKHYSDEYYVNPDFCSAVDLYKGYDVKYAQILNLQLPSLLEKTLDELRSASL